MSTYQTLSAMPSYATLAQATALTDSAQEYADDIVTVCAPFFSFPHESNFALCVKRSKLFTTGRTYTVNNSAV
jgi:hypothetical protein